MTERAIPSGLKVVTVEDSALIAERVERILAEMTGVELVGNAVCIDDALKLIRNNPPDVAILDINLGSLELRSGVELLQILRGMYPRMKIIMLTNFTDTRYRLLCQKNGADYFLDKSNDFDRIPETLKEIMRSQRLST